MRHIPLMTASFSNIDSPTLLAHLGSWFRFKYQEHAVIHVPSSSGASRCRRGHSRRRKAQAETEKQGTGLLSCRTPERYGLLDSHPRVTLLPTTAGREGVPARAPPAEGDTRPE